MHNLAVKVLIVCCILAGYIVPVNAQTRFITHFIKPFSYQQDGEFRGFAVDVVTEMMRRQGQPVSFDMYPFARALKMVQHGRELALFIVARRPEREKSVKWVGPLITSGVYFYVHKDMKTSINSLDDLYQLGQIGVGRGNADHTYLEKLGFTNLHPSNNQLVSMKMLASKRIDATVGSEIVMPEMANDADVDMNDLVRTDVKLYDSVLYLAFSLDTPDAEIKAWQRALDRLKWSGRYDEIYQKYLYRSRVRDKRMKAKD